MSLRPHKWKVFGLSAVVASAVGGYGAYRWIHRWRPTTFHRNAPEIEAILAEHAGQEVEHWSPVAPGSALRRHPIWRKLAAALYPLDEKGVRFDPLTHFGWLPRQRLKRPCDEHPNGGFVIRTNRLGMREDAEPAAEPPDLRVLVTGDSHTDGVCDNHESWANRLEAALLARHPERTIEVLNAARGGYSLYQYLGVLEKYLSLEPDVFIACVYGGNDFDELLTLHHLFARTIRPPGYRLYSKQVARAEEICRVALPQAFFQLKYFAAQPEERAPAVEAATAVVREMQRVCRLRDVRLILAYLPALPDVQAGRYDGVVERLADALDLDDDELAAADRMADELLANVAALGVETVDLRPAFRAADERLYWVRDHHLNLAGHALVARELLPLFEGERFE